MYLSSSCLHPLIGRMVDVVMMTERRIWDPGVTDGGVNIYVPRPLQITRNCIFNAHPLSGA
jgi:hypothetical protein